MPLTEKFWSTLRSLLEKNGLSIYDSIEPRAKAIEKTYSDRSVFFNMLGRYHTDARRYKMLGNCEKALEYLLVCLRIYDRMEANFQACGLMLDVGDCLVSLDLNEIALYCLKESLNCLMVEKDSSSLDLAALHLLLIVGIYILSNDFEKAQDYLKGIKASDLEFFGKLQREDCYRFITTMLRAYRKKDLSVFMSLEEKLTRRISDDWPDLMSRFQECVELYGILQALIERFKKSDN